MSRQELGTQRSTVWFDAAGFFPMDKKIAEHTSAAVTSARVSILSLYIPQQGSSACLFVCLLLCESGSHLLSWISFRLALNSQRPTCLCLPAGIKDVCPYALLLWKKIDT